MKKKKNWRVPLCWPPKKVARRAIFSATNIGDDFNNLNDHHAALEWMQRGLDLARPTGWPGSIGAVLTQTAGTLRSLGRLAQLDLGSRFELNNDGLESLAGA